MVRRTALVLAAALALAPRARADEKSARVAGADALFKEAEQLFSAGKIEEACRNFEASENLDPALGTLINVAVCHAREGKTATAWAEFHDALAQAKRRGQAARVDVIERELAALEKRVSKVTLDLGATKLDAVRVDGKALDPSEWSAPIILEPGTHTLEVSAVGKKSETRSLVVGEGSSSQTVKIGPLVDDTPATPQAPPARPPPTEAPPAPSAGKRTAGYVVLGVGAAGVAVGAVFGLLALSKKSDADASCQGRVDCPRDGYDANNAAHTDATISTIAFGVALVAIGVGTYLFLTSRTKAAAQAAPLVVRF